MDIEEEYHRTTRWLWPVFLMALAALLVLLFYVSCSGDAEGVTPQVETSHLTEGNPEAFMA